MRDELEVRVSVKLESQIGRDLWNSWNENFLTFKLFIQYSSLNHILFMSFVTAAQFGRWQTSQIL